MNICRYNMLVVKDGGQGETKRQGMKVKAD